MTHPGDPACTCYHAPPSEWAYLPGYVEPGSMGEADPDCPVHYGGCRECGAPAVIVEEFDEQIGYEEQARPVRVTVLACGHEIVRPGKWTA